MHLTNIQKHAVQSIIDKYQQNIKSISFKAPTGCGKTFIICNVISRLIKQIKDCGKTVCFICATISDGDLPKQMLNNFNEYQTSLNEIDGYTFLSQYHQSPSIDNKNWCDNNSYISPLENGVLIFGKSSFGKKRIFNQENTIGKLINEIKMKHYQLIYIRDEAHIGAENISHIIKETQSFEQLMQNSADFIIKMTATPQVDEENNLVEISENDLIHPSDDKYLIKTSPIYNPHSDEDMDEFTFFKEGINTFKKEVIKSYQNDQDLKSIHPACLIQIDNEPTDNSKYKKWRELLIKIENYMHDELNLQFSEYFSNNDSKINTNQQLSGRYKTLKEPNDPYSLSKNNSLYDVIIFKVAIATGWNIPRACMIIQLRSLTSKKLKIQTLGRIKRNPLKTLTNNENAMKYYIWSEVFNEKDFKIQKFTFNNSVKLINSFPKINIINQHDNELNIKEFKKLVAKHLEESRKNIENEFNHFKKDKLIKYHVQNINKQVIVNKIITCFQLFEFVDKLIYDNDKIYKLIKTIIHEQCKKTSIDNLLIYQYIIFSNQFPYIQKIKDFYDKCLDKQQRLFDNYHLTNNNKLPSEITQKYNTLNENTNNERKITIQDFSNFFYWPLDKNCEEFKVSSLPEEVVFDEIRKIIKSNNLKNIYYGKNPEEFSNNNVYFEYRDNTGKIKKAYIDGIIKFMNNKFFIFEIKSDNDIDPEKTNYIEVAMKEHWSKQHENLYFAIVKVGRNNVINNFVVYNKNLQSNELYTLERIIKYIYEC